MTIICVAIVAANNSRICAQLGLGIYISRREIKGASAINPNVATNDSWNDGLYKSNMGLTNNIIKPERNNMRITKASFPVSRAKITKNAIRDARTTVAPAPVMMAKNSIAIDPITDEVISPKNARIDIIAQTMMVMLNPDKTTI